VSLNKTQASLIEMFSSLRISPLLENPSRKLFAPILHKLRNRSRYGEALSLTEAIDQGVSAYDAFGDLTIVIVLNDFQNGFNFGYC
jgi:hypothetical protein